MELACVGRAVTGAGVGFISIAVPTYIGEVATPDVRGMLGRVPHVINLNKRTSS